MASDYQGMIVGVTGPQVSIKNGNRVITVKAQGKRQVKVRINGEDGFAVSDLKNGDKVNAYGARESVALFEVRR